MSTLRDYYGIYDSDTRRDLWWNVVTNRFYIRHTWAKPPNIKQCVKLGKWDDL